MHYFLMWSSISQHIASPQKYESVLTWSSIPLYNAGGNELLDLKATLSEKHVVTRRDYAD